VTWTREPLAELAAGHDAVVEVTAAVIDQALALQAPIVLPGASAGPYGVAVPAGASHGTFGRPAAGPGQMGGVTVASAVGLVTSSVVLNVAPTGQNLLRFLAAAADAGGRDLLIRLTLRNDTGGAVMLAASLTLGGMPRPVSSPSPVPAGATATIVLPVANVPPGTNPIEIRVFDLQDPTLEVLLHGTLALTQSAPQTLSPTATTATGTSPLVPPPPGLESRVTRTQTMEALPGRFAVDLDGSSEADVMLSCPVTVAIETTEAESLVARGWRGQFGFGPTDTQYSVTHRNALATLRVRAPLTTSVEPATRVVSAGCDLGAAEVTISSADPDLQRAIPELERQFQASLSTHSAQRAGGPRVDLAPRLSLVGALRPEETVNELSLQQVSARVLPAASATTKPALAVSMSLAGNTGPLGVPENFVGSDDFGTIVSQAVVQAVASFRWRVGDHPRILAGRPTEAEYDDHGTQVPVLLFPQMHQTSLIDGNTTVASINQSGPVTYGTSTRVFTFLMTDAMATTKPHPEDYVLLGGRGDFEIAAVLRKDTMQPAPEGVRKGFAVPDELKGVLFKWPFAMSGVGAPAPVTDANVEVFLQAMRAGVTSHLSRPFAEPRTVVLSKRSANGVDDYVLSVGALAP
jgi:hypothetical protein